MTQSKVLEQISTLVPKSHPPADRTDRPRDMSRRPIGTPTHPTRGMGLPEATERPAQTIERRFDLPEPPVGAVAPGLVIVGLQISRLQVLVFCHHHGHQTHGAAHHDSWNGTPASGRAALMRTGDAKTMLQVIIGTRQIRHVIAMKQTRSKVLGDL